MTGTKVETPTDHVIRANSKIRDAYPSRHEDASQISAIDSLYGSNFRHEKPQRLPDLRGLGSQGGKPRKKIIVQRPKIEIPKKFRQLSKQIHDQSLTDHSVVIENSQELPSGDNGGILAQSQIFDKSETTTRNQQQSRTHSGPFYMQHSSVIAPTKMELEADCLKNNLDLPGTGEASVVLTVNQ